MRNPKVEEWEDRLEELLRDADRELELRFGGKMPLHPARPEAGATLFRLLASIISQERICKMISRRSFFTVAGMM